MRSAIQSFSMCLSPPCCAPPTAPPSSSLPLLRRCCWVFGCFFSVPAHQKPFHQSVCVITFPLTAYYQRISISTSDLPQTPVIPLGTCVMQLGGEKKLRLAQTSPKVTLTLLISQIRPQTQTQTYEDCHHHSLRPSKHVCPTRLPSR